MAMMVSKTLLLFIARRSLFTQRSCMIAAGVSCRSNLCSQSAAADDPIIVSQWKHKTSQFGRVKVKSNLPVHIFPLLPPDDSPDETKITILSDKPQLADMLEDYKCLLLSPQEIECHFRPVSVRGNAWVKIQIPINFSICLWCLDYASASLHGMESTTIYVNTVRGNCLLDRIKSGMVTVFSTAGSIQCSNYVLGDIEMRTGADGRIQVGRLQGVHIFCSTVTGCIEAEAVYGQNSVFCSTGGDIVLGSAHGERVKIRAYQRGSLTIGSLDSGNLDAEVDEGASCIHLVRFHIVNVTTWVGDISLSFPDQQLTPCKIELHAKKIIADESLKLCVPLQMSPADNHAYTGYMDTNETDSSVALVRAHTSTGTVHLMKKTWLDSLNLDKFRDKSPANTGSK